MVHPANTALLQRLQTFADTSSSVAKIITTILAPCVLAPLDFRSLKHHRTYRMDH